MKYLWPEKKKKKKNYASFRGGVLFVCFLVYNACVVTLANKN